MPNKESQDVIHDFLEERKWLTFLAGYSDSSSVIYTLYRFVIVGFLLYMVAMTVLAGYLLPDKELIIVCIYAMLVEFYYIFWCLSMYLILMRSLRKCRTFLKSGIYRYEGEDEDDFLKMMKESLPKEIRRKSNLFSAVFNFTVIMNTTLFPLSQIALLGLSSDWEVMNPYLPHLFYQPFDTKTLVGAGIGWFLGVVYHLLMMVIECSVNWYYVSCVTQLTVHFRILNHSIANLQSRALAMYMKEQSLPVDISPAELLEDKNFQRCLYLCLRSNIQHHQALLRLRKLLQPFNGYFMLCMVLLAPVVYGTSFYLLSQENPINVTINLLFTFVADQFTTIFICVLGEDISNESEKIYSHLYSIDWFNYNKKLNQVLHIMMTNTMEPASIKSELTGVTASLETYGNLMSAMYKVTNIVGQSDLV